MPGQNPLIPDMLNKDGNWNYPAILDGSYAPNNSAQNQSVSTGSGSAPPPPPPGTPWYQVPGIQAGIVSGLAGAVIQSMHDQRLMDFQTQMINDSIGRASAVPKLGRG